MDGRSLGAPGRRPDQVPAHLEVQPGAAEGREVGGTEGLETHGVHLGGATAAQQPAAGL